MPRTLPLGLLLASLVAAPTAAAQDPGFRCSWQHVQVREGQVLPAAGLQLERPWVDLEFDQGTFYALEACGTLVGLAWSGSGSFQLHDPGPTHARLMYEQLASLPGRVEVSMALIVASDGAVDELVTAGGGWQEGPVAIPVRQAVQARIAAFDPADGKSSRPPGGLLYAPDPAVGGIFLDLRSSEIKRTGTEVMAGKLPVQWLTVTWSWFEGLRTREYGRVGVRGAGKDFEEVFASLPAPQEGQRSLPGLHRAFDLTHAKVDVRFLPTSGFDRDLKDVEAAAHLELEALDPSFSHLSLDLMEGVRRTLGDQWGALRVKGVHLNGESVAFDRAADRLWVPLGEAPAPGTQLTIDVLYEGPIVEPQGQMTVTALANGWYPRHWPTDRHTLVTAVTFPRFWKVASTGRATEELQEGQMRTVTSRCDRPVEEGAVFLLDGRSEKSLPPAEGLPVVRIVRASDTRKAGARFDDEVFTQLAAISELLGPFPYDELEIVERRVHGPFVSTPGVIPVGIFDSPPNVLLTTDVGRYSLLQALVRQYLEADMGVESFAEDWILEGLATLAECYALDRTDNRGRCLANLKQMREGWMNHLVASGTAKMVGSLEQSGFAGVPPMGLFGEPNSQLRGPLVMHRLRLLLGEEATWKMMRRVATNYRGQRLTTRSFRLQAQVVATADLDPFFQGWVQHTPRDPIIDIRWRSVEEADGTWTLHLRGRVDAQRTGRLVPIVTPLLVRIRFGKEEAWQRIVLTDMFTDLQIRGIPEEPRKPRVDDLTWPGRVVMKKQKVQE